MTNPNGANQHTNDEREQLCWDFYVESVANGTTNAYESAIKAGYSHDHSRNITLQGWFKERLNRLKRKDMLSDAEKLLHKTLNYEHVDSEGKINVPLLSVQTKVADSLVKTLGKDEGYSSRTEVTGKNGEPISTATEEITNLAKTLNELATGNNRTSFPSDGIATVSLDKEVSDQNISRFTNGV